MSQNTVKIAYLIMIHKNLDQFKRLFEAVYDPDNYYLVHVDRKSEHSFHRALGDFIRAYPNAHKLESQSVLWAGWSMVDVALRAIEELLKVTGDWDYFINLSGQDFPLQSQQGIRALLAKSRERNYLDARDPVTDWPKALLRVRYYFLELHVKPFWRPIGIPIPRRFPRGAKPYVGSSWLILTRPFCQWLSQSPQVERFKRFYRHTYCPDEGFFQTVFMHSPFRSTLVNDTLRAIELSGRNHPRIWTKADLDSLLSSGKLFARKFDPAVDEEVISDLEQHVRGESRP